MRLSFPILLVLVGLAISLVPGLPRVTLAPDVVFLVFLPPLLYQAAWSTSWREFKRLRNTISLQAVGLVFCTAAVVAWVAHGNIPGFTWALGFLLGGIIAPPDAVAATSVLQGLRIPRTSVAILEGESLVNDATSLIVVRFALAALGTGLFVLEQAAVQLAWVSVAGVGLGLLIAHGVYLLHRQLRSSAQVDTALTLLTPYLEYVLAEQVHASGVLAVVAGGLYLSARQHHFLDARTRVFAVGTWATAVFVLNGAVFILIGLQLPIVVEDLRASSLLDAISFGLLISLAAIVVRLAWTFAAAFLPSLIPARQRPDWKIVALVGWAGMRGVVSLAAALAIPTTLPDGGAFPQRSLLVFVTFVVILVTLVAQGLSLPMLVRVLRFDLPDDEHEHRQALDDHLTAHVGPKIEPTSDDSMLRDHVSSQRTELLRLKGAGKVSHELSREKELELDLELARLDGRLEARTRH
jgi:CPA1 family monovalent cation:H+ antiporter